MVFTHRPFADMFVGLVFICFYSFLRLYDHTFGPPSIYGDLSGGGGGALWGDAGWALFFFTSFVAFCSYLHLESLFLFCFEEWKWKISRRG